MVIMAYFDSQGTSESYNRPIHIPDSAAYHFYPNIEGLLSLDLLLHL